MLDTTTSIVLSLIFGSAIMGVACFIKKSQTRRQFLSLFSLGAVLVVSGITRVTVAEGDQFPPVFNQTLEQTEEAGIEPFFTNPQQVSVMNTDQTQVLGTYLTATTPQTELSKEELILFYERVVLDSEQDWVTLILGDGKGVMFPGSTASFTYGELDEEACVSTVLGSGLLLEETVEYQHH